MPKPTKDLLYSQQHVSERASERYGLVFNGDDYRKLNEAVQRSRAGEERSNDGGAEDESEAPLAPGTAKLLNHEGDEQIWGVPWGMQTLVCVWSVALGRVTTLLPEGTAVTRRKGTKIQKAKK